MAWNYTDVVFEITAALDLEKINPDQSGTGLRYDKCVHAVLLFLAHATNREKLVCWPGTKRIMRHTHLSESAVHRAIACLRKAGLLTVKPPSSSRTTNTYRLNLEKLKDCAKWCKDHVADEPDSSFPTAA